MLHSDAPSTQPAFSAGSLWPIAAGSLVAILGLAYGLRGGTQDREVISNQHTLSISVHQLQQQVKDLSERLSALNALQEKRALVIEPEPKAPPRVIHQTKAVPSPKITNDLKALRQRGERDYHEFQLAKSKQYSRTGPVSLALRKADTKRKRYDIDLILDDVKLEKRNVNLYEPIAFRSGSQSLELVVNEVTKDKVKGYVSVPKSQQARF